ncbi:MAG: hypothetical protein LBT31_06045 [Synergistaceae bacterium]|jgi:hypothetical protein|nr:hypothetical protein [Synergistaceae bacterium]
MKFIVLDENKGRETLGTFFSEKNYSGESQDLKAGVFTDKQLSIGRVGSVKLRQDVTFAAYRSLEKSAPPVLLNDDAPDLESFLGFSPNAFALTLHASVYKGEERIGTLNPGGYDSGSLAELKAKGGDTLRVPDGLFLRFWNGDYSDKTALSFKEGKIPLDGDIMKNEKFAIGILSPNKLPEIASNLSDEELAAVAGGCKAAVCGGQACASDMGLFDACGGKACGINVIPITPVSP